MNEPTAARPSRAPLYLGLGCLALVLLGGCGLFALVALGLVAAGLEGEAGGPDAEVVAVDVDATLGYTLPAGWRQDGPWWVREQVDPTGPITTAQVRLAPAIPATGDVGDALRGQWRAQVPPELADRASGMVYRRYVGDGLVAQFVIGRGRERGRKADSLFTVYLIDCGAAWQPVVVAQTYADPSTNVEAVVSHSGGFSFSTSAAMAEELLATLRCPAGRGRALVDPAALVGHYHYGSGAGLQWENVRTGATTMTSISWSGELELRADGTYASRFRSASGEVGRLGFAGEEHAGTWRVEGDLLVLAGDQERRQRVAGLTRFQDGVQALVLLRPGVAVGPTTVTDPADLYTTRP